MAMLAIASTASAEDSFSVDAVTLPQNVQADLTIKFNFATEGYYNAVSFSIELPEALSFVTDDKDAVIYTSGDCFVDHTFTANMVSGGLNFASLSLNSTPLVGTSGTIATFPIKVASEVNIGDVLKGKVKNIDVSLLNGTVNTLSDVEFNITIGEPVDTRTILDESLTTAPTAATGVDVRVKRTFTPSVWNTICLPFSMSSDQVTAAFGTDVQLGEFVGWETTEYDGGDPKTIAVSFKSVNAIEANIPYIIKMSSALSEFTVDGVNIDPEEDPCVVVGKKNLGTLGSFTGSYVPVTIEEKCLFLNSNKFYYSAGSTTMKGYRAYFYFQDALPSASASRQASVRIVFNENATGLQTVSANAGEGEEIYTLSGQRVKNAGKGVYIVNGKKVIKK